MNIRTSGTLVVLAFFSLAQAAEKKEDAGYGPQPLKGNYQVYGGTLSEQLPPTPKDRKVAFVFKGAFAKDLFSQIGPDVKKANACSSAANYRERRRGDVDCVYTKDSGYACYFGIDVPTGKSTYGAIC